MSTPLWRPDLTTHRPFLSDFIAGVNRAHGLSLPQDAYAPLHAWSIHAPADFWSSVWDLCGVEGDKHTPELTALPHPPYGRIFPNARLNYAENMLRYWIDHPDDPAIIHTHENTKITSISGQALCAQVSVWVQALRRAGVTQGDCVGVYLPNIPVLEVILLACATIGAVFCSAGMEMGHSDFLSRFSQARPKLLISSRTYRYGAKVIDRTTTLHAAHDTLDSLHTLIYVDCQTGTVEGDFLNGLSPAPLPFERLPFHHPLYILFSSGSTGAPKCFVHSAGGVLLKHLSEYRLHADIGPGDRSFYHATPSWMMWNWSASALAVGATLLKYSGNPFSGSPCAQLRFTAEQGCTHHGTAAPVIMAWRDKGLDVRRDLDLSALRCMLYTGAVLPEAGFTYVAEHIKPGIPLFGISGGTDIVGCFVSGNPLSPVYAGEIAGPCLGVDAVIWDDNGAPCPPETSGELVIRQPLPSMPVRFLQDPDYQRYDRTYFQRFPKDPAVWHHGDTVKVTSHGHMVILGRSDGTLNQNGVRIGSSVLYAQLDQFSDQIKAAAAVDFIRPDTKQAITVLCLALHDASDTVPRPLIRNIRTAIKTHVGPYSVPTDIIAVPDVLRTKNGKLAEVVTKALLSGAAVSDPDLYGAELVDFYQQLSRTLHTRYQGS